MNAWCGNHNFTLPGCPLPRCSARPCGEGGGRFLILAAIGLALSVSEIIGCRDLAVDSMPKSMSSYKRQWFRVVELSMKEICVSGLSDCRI